MGLARSTAIEIGLDVGFREFDARWTTVDDDTDATAVGFAPGGDAEEVAKRITHRERLRKFLQGVKYTVSFWAFRGIESR